MPKAGKYDYPFYDLDSVLEKLRIMHETLREDEMDRGVVAETLGMAERGGGFAYLISSIEKYGLIKTGGGKVTMTPLGKLALYGEETERNRARNDAVRQVALFKELYEQYGVGITEEQTRAFLRQKAFVDVSKAQKIAPQVNKMYKNVSRYISPAIPEPLPLPTEMSEGEGRRESMPLMGSQALEIRYKGVVIQIPPDDIEAIELAEKALAFMKQQVKDKHSSKSEKTN